MHEACKCYLSMVFHRMLAKVYWLSLTLRTYDHIGGRYFNKYTSRNLQNDKYVHDRASYLLKYSHELFHMVQILPCFKKTNELIFQGSNPPKRCDRYKRTRKRFRSPLS